MNNTTEVLRSGSSVFGNNPTCQPTTNLSEFIAKQVPCRSDSLASPVKLIVCSAKTTNSVRQSKSLGDRKTICAFVECWPNKSKFSSLMEMMKVHSSSRRSTPAHKFSAPNIEETALENLCSNLHFLEVVNNPDLCVPGVSTEVLQRVISQANKVNVCWWPAVFLFDGFRTL